MAARIRPAEDTILPSRLAFARGKGDNEEKGCKDSVYIITDLKEKGEKIRYEQYRRGNLKGIMAD